MAEGGLLCFAGRGGAPQLYVERLLLGEAAHLVEYILEGVCGEGLGWVEGCAVLPFCSPSHFCFLFQLEIHILPDCFHCRHSCHCRREWGLLGGAVVGE